MQKRSNLDVREPGGGWLVHPYDYGTRLGHAIAVQHPLFAGDAIAQAQLGPRWRAAWPVKYSPAAIPPWWDEK